MSRIPASRQISSSSRCALAPLLADLREAGGDHDERGTPLPAHSRAASTDGLGRDGDHGEVDSPGTSLDAG